MSLIVKEESQREPIPTGMQHAVCSMVCDIGTQIGSYEGRETRRRQCVIIWELEETQKEGKYAGERFTVSKFYSMSLSKKSALRADIQSWRGVPFSEQELQGFDLLRLVGANCFLNIIEEKERRVIKAITPIAKTMQKIAPKLKEEPEWVAKFRAKSIEATGGDMQSAPPHDEEPLPF